MAQITHQGNRQIVDAATLRRILLANGEECFCNPDPSSELEWDAGGCPVHPASDDEQVKT